MAFSFGTGELQISATAGVFSIGKLQNVSINITYENAQLRGSSDVFPCNTQFFDGVIEGSFEHGDIELSQLGLIIGGSGAFAGAGGSGTLTLTGQSKPGGSKSVSLILSSVTNGITATITIGRVYIPSLTLDFSRTEYTIPNSTFMVEADTGGSLMTITQ